MCVCVRERERERDRERERETKRACVCDVCMLRYVCSQVLVAEDVGRGKA